MLCPSAAGRGDRCTDNVHKCASMPNAHMVKIHLRCDKNPCKQIFKKSDLLIVRDQRGSMKLNLTVREVRWEHQTPFYRKYFPLNSIKFHCISFCFKAQNISSEVQEWHRSVNIRNNHSYQKYLLFSRRITTFRWVT